MCPLCIRNVLPEFQHDGLNHLAYSHPFVPLADLRRSNWIDVLDLGHLFLVHVVDFDHYHIIFRKLKLYHRVGDVETKDRHDVDTVTI